MFRESLHTSALRGIVVVMMIIAIVAIGYPAKILGLPYHTAEWFGFITPKSILGWTLGFLFLYLIIFMVSLLLSLTFSSGKHFYLKTRTKKARISEPE